MGQHVAVQLIGEERSTLEQRLKGGEDKARSQTRARVLLLLDRAQGTRRTQHEVAEVLGISRNTVAAVARRYVEQGVASALVERPRPGAAPKLSGAVEVQLVTLVCSDPPVGRKRWTLRLLAAKMVELGYIESISNVAVYNALKKTNSNRLGQNGTSWRERHLPGLAAFRACPRGKKNVGAFPKRVQST